MQDEVPTVMQNFKFYIMKCSTLHRPFMAEKSFHRGTSPGCRVKDQQSRGKENCKIEFKKTLKERLEQPSHWKFRLQWTKSAISSRRGRWQRVSGLNQNLFLLWSSRLYFFPVAWSSNYFTFTLERTFFVPWRQLFISTIVGYKLFILLTVFLP